MRSRLQKASAPPYTNMIKWHTSQTDGSAHKSNYTEIRPRTAREMNRRGFGPRMVFTNHHMHVTTGGREPERANRELGVATSYAYARATYRTFIIKFISTMGITPKSAKM